MRESVLDNDEMRLTAFESAPLSFHHKVGREKPRMRFAKEGDAVAAITIDIVEDGEASRFPDVQELGIGIDPTWRIVTLDRCDLDAVPASVILDRERRWRVPTIPEAHEATTYEACDDRKGADQRPLARLFAHPCG